MWCRQLGGSVKRDSVVLTDDMDLMVTARVVAARMKRKDLGRMRMVEGRRQHRDLLEVLCGVKTRLR